jgi:SET domain-containing protein
MGNMTRFINHGDDYTRNVEAKIVLVNLEHRIKFVAIKNIRAGSEILFDYGEGYTKKHNLKTTVGAREMGLPERSIGQAARKTMRLPSQEPEVVAEHVPSDEYIAGAGLVIDDYEDDDYEEP